MRGFDSFGIGGCDWFLRSPTFLVQEFSAAVGQGWLRFCMFHLYWSTATLDLYDAVFEVVWEP